jgi:hypothetical protein
MKESNNRKWWQNEAGEFSLAIIIALLINFITT